MGAAISHFVFFNMKPSYDTNISYFEYINRIENCTSYGLEFKVPIRYYDNNHEYTMIMCHGNAEDIGQTDPINISELFGVNVCLFDYAGYGLHSCKYSSEFRCNEDAVAVYKYLINEKKVDPTKIILYGRSLGTAVASFLANYCEEHNHPVVGMVLISPFLSICKIKTDIWVPGDIFTTHLLAPKIKTHVCIIHGEKDTLINVSHGKKLSELFENCTVSYIQDKGHNDIIDDINSIDAIKQFIEATPSRSYPPSQNKESSVVEKSSDIEDTVIDKDVVKEEIVNVTKEETIDKKEEIVEENIVNVIKEEVVNKDVIKEEVVNKDVVKEEVVNKDIVKENIIKEKIKEEIEIDSVEQNSFDDEVSVKL
jgi:pimeloyl-ACP methyl ester carboxylesterase